MSARLNESMIVHRLAADLKLKPSPDPVQDILKHCHKVVREFLVDYPSCATPSELLLFLANKLGSRLVEIHSDAELVGVETEYTSRGESIFATLQDEFRDLGTYAITLKLLRPESWESKFVSIIDCRGVKALRRYHTKWHELGHLFILTDQSRFAFRRTHDAGFTKNAEESLVDTIAGELSFYPPMVLPYLRGDISFEKIESIRDAICPEASLYSSIMNLTKMWPSPCVWLEVRLAHKAKDRDNGQAGFPFREQPAQALRAVHVSANPAARDAELAIIPNFRVPKNSIIYKVFEKGLSGGEATENLEMWESSGGTRLPSRLVFVRVRRIGETIHAIVCPANDSVIN